MENKVTGIVKALSDFQNACPPIKKDHAAGSGNFTYKYGSLPMILEVIKPHMKAASLTFAQPIINIEGVEHITTILYHTETGETIESQMQLPTIKFQGMNELQSKGSAITYLRRYGLMSLLGIVAEEDDNDGQGTTEAITPKPEKNQPEKPWLNPKEGGQDNPKWMDAVKYLSEGGTIEEIKTKYKIGKGNEDKLLNESM